MHLIGYGATFRLAERQPKFTRMFTTQQHMWESDEDSDYLIFEVSDIRRELLGAGCFPELREGAAICDPLLRFDRKRDATRESDCLPLPELVRRWSACLHECSGVVSDSTSYNCFRGGVVASGSPSTIKITDFVAEKSQFGKAMDIEIDTEPHNKTTLTIERLTAHESVDLGTQEGSVVNVTDSTIIGGKTVIYGFKNKITIEARRSGMWK